MTALHEFRVLGVPVPLHARASAHLEAVQRELDLIRSDDDASDSVPVRLRRLVDELEGRFGSMGDEPAGALADAAARGEAEIDLRYELPIEAGAAAEELLELLREVDEYCRAGDLLTLATPPEPLAYREWFLGEFVRQARGAPPLRWDPDLTGEPDPEPPTAAAAVEEATEAPDALPELPDSWSVERTGHAARLACDGDLDLASAPVLRSLVAGLHAEGVRSLEVDLTEVRFLDSVGLSVLITMQLRMSGDGASLVVRPSQAVARVLELASVHDLLVR